MKKIFPGASLVADALSGSAPEPRGAELTTPRPSGEQGPRFGHGHRKRPLWAWVVPLLLVVALIVALPRLAGWLGG